MFQDFEDEIGPPPSGEDKSCSVSTNLITDIFNAAKCLTNNLDKAETDIETAINDNFDDLTNIKDDLENVQGLEKALENDTEDDDNKSNSASQSNPSSTQSSSSKSSSSSSSSCTALQTASDCSAICSGTVTATGGSTAYSSQGCSTTCFSTFSACSATNSITTVSTVASGDVCTWGGATSIPAASVPPGPYVTAWFDYGISCAGSGCGYFSTGSDVTVTAPVSGSSTATSTPPSNSASATSSPASDSISSSSASSSASASTSSAPSSSTAISATSSVGVSGPSGTLSCVPSTAFATGVPQDQVQANLTEWCSGDLNLFKPGIGCDNTNHNGYYLDNKCTPPLLDYYLQYYFPGIIMYFNVSLVAGTDTFVANSSTCLSALGSVLNGCPPTSGSPLMKYGGSITTDDGTGNKAVWQIILTKDDSSPPASSSAVSQPPPSSTPPTPPPSSSSPAPSPSVVPCKSGGMYSNGCGDNCGTNGKCESASAGYPTPEIYYYCKC